MPVDLRLDVVTLQGHEYLLFTPKEGGEPVFPSDAFQPGESPAAAAKRVVRAWTGTSDPKLEILDFRSTEGDTPTLTFVFRAIVTEDPEAGEAAVDLRRYPRGGLPEKVGPYQGRDVDEMQKTSLNYKLTRA